MQRALIQFGVPKNYEIVKKALIKAGREDLIGSGKDCLIPAKPPRNNSGKKVKSNISKKIQNNTRSNEDAPKRKSNHSKSSRKKRNR